MFNQFNMPLLTKSIPFLNKNVLYYKQSLILLITFIELISFSKMS